LGRSRGGLTTKIHAVVEGLGNLAGFVLTAGNVNDCTQAETLLDEAEVKADGKIETVTADKGYDSQAIVNRIEALGPKRSFLNSPTEKKLARWTGRNTRTVTW